MHSQYGGSVVVFDGDNTVWDTNAVFHAAQLALLQELQVGGVLKDAAAEMNVLRCIDRRLAAAAGVAEYNFKHLVRALIGQYLGWHSFLEPIATDLNLPRFPSSGDVAELAARADTAYFNALRRIPPLLEDAVCLLRAIRSSAGSAGRSAILILSEGNEERLGAIWREHETTLAPLVDELLIARKDTSAFRLARQKGVALLGLTEPVEGLKFVAIGDSLKRDVRPANEVGFITIYRPAGYLGDESPTEALDRPVASVLDLRQSIPLLRNLGVPLKEAT